MQAQLLLLAHILLACAVIACASDNPFSWDTTASAESKFSVPLSAPDLRLRETSYTVELSPIIPANTCVPSTAHTSQPEAHSFSLILLWVLSVFGVYLLGWRRGVSQAEARHEMQQAALDDRQEEHEESTRAEATAASEAIAFATLQSSADSDQGSHSPTDAISLSSVDTAASDIQQDVTETATGVCEGAQLGSSSANAHVPAQAQQIGTSAQPGLLQSAPSQPGSLQRASLQPRPLQGHPEPSPQQDQLHSLAPASPLAGPQQQQGRMLMPVPPAPDPDSSQQGSAEVAIMASASRIIERILAHMRVRMDDLSLTHRIQLVPAVVQALGVAVHHHHQLEDHRLQGIANDQSASRNTIIQQGQADNHTWRQAKVRQQQLQDFKLQIADCLMCGLIIMLLGMLYFGAVFGYYDSKLEHCNTRRFSFFARLWGPLDVVACYVSATMDLVGSVAAMLLTVYAVKRFGLLTDSVAKPMTGLVLFLGVGCGLLGKYVIGRLGGDSFVWLFVFEVWVLQQVLSVWFVQALHSCLQADRTFWQQLRTPVYMLLMGVIMPFVVSACPFWRSLYKQAIQ